MKLEVLNINGEKTGREVSLPESVFGVEPNEHVVYLAVKQYRNNQRQGTHKAKERGEVKGSRRKIKRQKGTGTARAGDIKNPLFVGGGRVFGPRPRSYRTDLNKKVKTLARKSVLAGKFKENKVIVVEDFTFDAPKTKKYQAIINSLNVNGKTLFMSSDYSDANKMVFLASRNLDKAEMTCAVDFNVYEVLHADYLILAESTVEALAKTFEN